jgi:hypothetical protein
MQIRIRLRFVLWVQARKAERVAQIHPDFKLNIDLRQFIKLAQVCQA